MTESRQVLGQGSPVRQFSVMLPNRSGSLASLVRLLRNAAVEVVGVSLQNSRDAAIARILTTDPDVTSTVFLEKGIPYTECEMLVVSLRESGPGLLQCLETLMEAGLNVDFAYAVLATPGRERLLALCLAENSRAAKHLRSSGFKLLFQEDLSR